MRKSKKSQPLTPTLFDDESPNRLLILSKPVLSETLKSIQMCSDVASLREAARTLRNAVAAGTSEANSLLASDIESETAALRSDVLLAELDQVIAAHTIDRAQYYIKRLERGVNEARTSKINDINLRRWKEYDEIITDSLWVMPRRDTSGAHLGWYWGNFVPQIPHQMLLRFTKRGEWVLDPFLGSGTTLVECKRLGRNGIGIELAPNVAERATEIIAKEANRHRVAVTTTVGDSRTIDLGSVLRPSGIEQADFVIMHPPYHDIVKFSDEEGDLCNAETIGVFLSMFGEVLDNVTPFLKTGRHLALVVGDKYSAGQWIPLGFYCMNEVMKRGYTLKSTIVKNFEQTRAKRDQKQLWRYRALVGGFYVFKHEYIFLFAKTS